MGTSFLFVAIYHHEENELLYRESVNTLREIF